MHSSSIAVLASVSLQVTNFPVFVERKSINDKSFSSESAIGGSTDFADSAGSTRDGLRLHLVLLLLVILLCLLCLLLFL